MKRTLSYTDGLLNKITMYLLVTFGLGLVLIIAVILSVAHELSQSATAIVVATAVLALVCWIVNRLSAIIWDAKANKESWLITALILALIIPPATVSLHHLMLIALAGAIAILSKFVLVYRSHHLFNPAALAMLILGLFNLLPAIWWVGSPILFVPVLLLGLLVVRKIRRFQVFSVFLVMAIVMAFVVGLTKSQTAGNILHTTLLSSPLVFFGSIMLVEPETLPASNFQQLIYAFIAGLLFSSQLRFGSVSTTPELVLIVVNIYSLIVSPKRTIHLKLKSIDRISNDAYQASFMADDQLDFKAGQYATINVVHPHSDARGVRRTFSIASAPGSNDLTIAFKVPLEDRVSSFKKALTNLGEGDQITASSIAGTFTLPEDDKQKLVFIAGGIGITPFLSMLKDLVKNKQNRDITLLYFVDGENDLYFKQSFDAAAVFGLKLIPVFSSDTAVAAQLSLHGRLTGEDIKKVIPDLHERQFYISGAPGFVDGHKRLLLRLSIKNQKIRTDHFAGY